VLGLVVLLLMFSASKLMFVCDFVCGSSFCCAARSESILDLPVFVEEAEEEEEEEDISACMLKVSRNAKQEETTVLAL